MTPEHINRISLTLKVHSVGEHVHAIPFLQQLRVEAFDYHPPLFFPLIPTIGRDTP